MYVQSWFKNKCINKNNFFFSNCLQYYEPWSGTTHFFSVKKMSKRFFSLHFHSVHPLMIGEAFTPQLSVLHSSKQPTLLMCKCTLACLCVCVFVSCTDCPKLTGYMGSPSCLYIKGKWGHTELCLLHSHSHSDTHLHTLYPSLSPIITVPAPQTSTQQCEG